MVYQKRNSNDSTISTSEKKLNNDILESIGGESQLHFLAISFCERITNDDSLNLFYGGLEMSNLIALQKDMLLWAFLGVSAEDFESHRGKLILRHHLLAKQGFCGKHFKMLEKHFADAMLDVWLDKEAMDLCSKYFKTLRSIFDDCKDFEVQAAVDADEMMDTITASFRISRLLSEEFGVAQ